MMKTLNFLLISFLFTLILNAQKNDPGFSYQAIVRDNSGIPVSNTEITVHVELYNHLSSDILFEEEHQIMTDNFGQVNVIIGQGNRRKGSILDIPWSENSIYYKVDIIDEDNGLTLSSQAQIMAVPYALHAITADGLTYEKAGNSRMKEVFWNVIGNEVTKGSNRIGSLNNSAIAIITDDKERIFVGQEGDTKFTENAAFEKNMYVEGDSYIGKDEFVRGTVHVDNELEVKENVSIGGNLDVYGDARFHENMEVTGSSTFNEDVIMNKNLIVNENLEVYGTTRLFDDLTVENNKTTTLTGDLIVEQNTIIEGELVSNGQAAFNGDIDFTSNVVFAGNVIYEGDIQSFGDNLFTGNNTINNANIGNTNIGNANITQLIVDQSATFNSDANFNTDIYVDGTTNTQFLNVTEKANIKNMDMSGQLNVEWESPNSISSERESYPLTVQGSDNGIFIKVKPDQSANSNNFISFFSGDETMRGRIEGMTSIELTTSFPYIWENTMSILAIATLAAEGLACGVQLDLGEVAVMVAQGILEGVQIGEFNTTMQTQVGIGFESGSGDYAEWLERANLDEKLTFGDIVGVKGGKISKNFTNPDHYMVVSMSPIVLGNMPSKNKEADFEKIAFMGQVPVKVLGEVHIGDYIIASSRNDGMGYAVNSQSLKMSEINRIVGVAWSASDDNKLMNLINVAVGINTNDMSLLVQKQQAEINEMKGQLNQLIGYLSEKDSNLKLPYFDIDDEIIIQKESIVKNNEPVNIKAIDDSAVLEKIKQIQAFMKVLLEERNIDYKLYEQTNRLVTEPEYLLQTVPSIFNQINK